MPWTEEETTKFQMENNQALTEINATLKPDPGLSGKVGIFCPGQVGDLATVTSVLKYRDMVFKGKEIIWFCNFPNADLLRYAPISEVRPWPWAGNGLPAGTPDFYPLLSVNNRLNTTLAKEYELTKDLDDGYFPTPWMVENRQGDYAEIAKKIFGVADRFQWHPYLSISPEEVKNADDFKNTLVPGRKTIMLETYFGSGQSAWDDSTTAVTLKRCRELWGPCNFLFASHKGHEQFKDEEGYYSCAEFTVRQAALLNEYCDLFIGVSSGISVATSCWNAKPVHKLQFCGSQVCSTKALANGYFDLVTSDNKPREQAQQEYEQTLIHILKHCG